jgi:PPP family 3-phenylpropionic acid transporter
MVMLALAAAGLIQASHGLNSMAMLTWRARGVSDGLCGILWETGQLADIAFLWWLSCHPQSPSRLLLWGAAAAVVRWAGFAAAPLITVLFGLQMLHALSFTATYVSSVQLIAELIDERDSLLAQAMHWAVATGLFTGVGVVGAGVLYESWGVAGYWLMCGLAVLGLSLALLLNRPWAWIWTPPGRSFTRNRIPMSSRATNST